MTVEQRSRALGLLREASWAAVAMVDGGRPYVVPMNFAFEPAVQAPPVSRSAVTGAPDGRLYLHSGPGRKAGALARNPRVCVVIAADATFDRGSTPCSDGFVFRSVMVEGTAELLDDPQQREHALRAIVNKYDAAATDAPFDHETLAQTLVYAVAVETLTYKERPPSRGD